MSKTSVLSGFQDLTIQQSIDISFESINGKNVVIQKTTGGSGYTGNLEDLAQDYWDLDYTDQSWVIDQFNGTSQVAGGRHDCP